MLKLTDLGCNEHQRRQIRLSGLEAKLMADLIYNLPHEGDFHTFICEYGHTHRLSFQVKEEGAGTSKLSHGMLPLGEILKSSDNRHIN
jgi:hypothetical protein